MPRWAAVMSGLAAAAAAAAAAPLVDVAVVGGGFGGMATAWHLAKKGIVNNTRVTVFDRDLPGRGGASSVAAGILHPLTPRGKLIWRGEEGMQSAMELVQVAQNSALPHQSIVTCKDIIRPVFTAEQDATFAAALRQNSKWLERLSVEEYLNLVPGANPINLGAYRIKGAVVLNSPLYLQSLWKALESKGHVWSQASVEDPATLLRRYGGNFDAVVVAAGADSVSMLNIPDVRLVKGQSILLRNERHGNLSPLQCGVLCGQYVMPSQVDGADVIIAGATQEHILPTNLHQAPAENPKRDLLDKVFHFYPEAARRPEVGSTVGVRVIRERGKFGRLPMAGRYMPGIWGLAALGARGLIHHAHLGSLLAECVLQDRDEMPKELGTFPSR